MAQLNNIDIQEELKNEVKLYLTQVESNQELKKITTPFKSYFLSPEQDQLAYMFCRSMGGSSRLSLLMEWLSQTLQVTLDSSELFEVNKDYTIELLKDEKKIYSKSYEFYVRQLTKSHQSFYVEHLLLLKQEVKKKLPFLTDYLDNTDFDTTLSSELALQYLPNLKNYDEAAFCTQLSQSFTYISISLPILVGLANDFRKESSSVDHTKIKWKKIKEFLAYLAILTSLSTTFHAEKYYYLKSVKIKDFNELMKKDIQYFTKEASKDEMSVSRSKRLKDKIYGFAKESLNELIVPQTVKTLLTNTLDWSYSK
jgi:hypothetical protein